MRVEWDAAILRILRMTTGNGDLVSLPVDVPVLNVDGVAWIIVALLYGAGLRLQECLELRVKDIDLERRQIVIRRGKGQKDRPTVLPGTVIEPLSRHLEAV